MTKIGVIGLGLIGGSIFKDLSAAGYDVVGISKSQNGPENVYSDYSYLKDRDLVFVCKEMRKTLEVLDEIQQYVNTKTVVTDVCSLKKFVSKANYSYNFVPSHPMAGTEFSGWENSKTGLFDGAKWVITPLSKDYKKTILEQVIHTLGAEVIYCTPDEHDEAAAMISHMPMLVAQALYKTAQENPIALKLASSGFRDMTRLALSNVDMAEDMVLLNSKNIETSLLKLYKEIGTLTKQDYRSAIVEIKDSRSKMYKNGKNVL